MAQAAVTEMICSTLVPRILALHSVIQPIRGSPLALVAKNSSASEGDIGDMGLIPGSGRFLAGAHAHNLLQYCCLENPMDRGAWRAAVSGEIELDTTEQLREHAFSQPTLIGHHLRQTNRLSAV